MDIRALLAQMAAASTNPRIARNPAAQFGTPARRYLGAEILPERLVTENAYREEAVRYRSVLANAGTRYSPTQKKKGVLVGSVDVVLAESDIASELTSRDYDALLRILGTGSTMQAMANLINFLDITVNQPLVELLEVWRWQAIVSALVQARGDNDYKEDFAYPNPAGSRVTPAAAWTLNTTDIWADIMGRVQYLSDKGFSVNRIFTSRRVIGIMANNNTVKTRAGRVTVSATGQIQSSFGRVTLSNINEMANDDGLPAFELYDLIYRTSTGSGRFMPDTVMVFVGTTGRSETVDLGDTQNPVEVLDNTLGYTAVGRAAGQATPGRHIRSEAFDNKPPRVEAEGWQTAVPIILEPDAITVIQGI